ncbi:aminodeoxychorismate/anthranilate synthase component II [Vibrio brasiliensis]|jgi:anthranilate synthase component 2|uniref:anthranilate synthase n=1 Tax=Vibrio brasiliensis LMG 20546 TaxID=945543 RepID=E8LSB6_9VIBR|nr:aminodeoxychorismate/anthranilate synthase component II [Vibrio brasiliensis]EGA66363.1 anthranilate synthase component II [Vibrio brasiliensis LMG 20546]MCG9647342.1 aminodeoxychorismate/anthranilate synthase component II [Vibrio brasiliensis]MCG9725590.1 aminodeoxychorismate/anthranilate synthase component II [Vibrio brasiliensis]MCG9750866.1 aminodeoxychorismate/anthranilate synthase component II [Vibrio brasiliensis]MCG9783694.1 aminodeoxychorismate/anthranilate synthase component II [V
MANIIFIDNFDSFTYNLVDQFRSLGHQVTVYRNNIAAQAIESAVTELDNPVVLLSPGPGAPSEAGSMPEIIQRLKGKVPMIGICLGHQAIVEAYGGTVAGAGEIIHGKVSMMEHDNHPTYQELPSPLAIARYHSLVATEVPDALTITAEVDGLVMSVVQEQDKVCGFQFHPESIMTTYGATLLANAIEWALENNGK